MTPSDYEMIEQGYDPPHPQGQGMNEGELVYTGPGELTALRAENRRLREALTPSAATKAAYIGEFKFNPWDGDEVTVPWPTIKQIMAAISARAALAAEPASALHIEWRVDGFGKPGTALYLGNLYVGSINHWSRTPCVDTPWRGWFMSDDDGAETGWFASEDEARKSVEAALQNALNSGNAQINALIASWRERGDALFQVRAYAPVGLQSRINAALAAEPASGEAKPPSSNNIGYAALRQARDEATRADNEACAKMFDELGASNVAAAIRARKDKP